MESFRVDESQDEGVESTRDARIESAHGKGKGFIIIQVHPHGLRRHVAVPDGNESPSHLGLEELDRRDGQDHCDGAYQVIEMNVLHRGSEEVKLGGLQSHPSAEEFHVLDDGGHGHAESHGRDRQVRALQAQRGKPQDEPGPGGNEGAEGEGDEQGKAHLAHEHDRGESPDGKEPGMAQGDLAGVSYEDIQADGHDAVNDDEVQKVNGNAQKVGLGDKPG